MANEIASDIEQIETAKAMRKVLDLAAASAHTATERADVEKVEGISITLIAEWSKVRQFGPA